MQGLEYLLLQTRKRYTTLAFLMSEADIAVILNRLDQLEETLKEVHREVKKTNGRVTELEKEEARLEGQKEGKQTMTFIGTTVLSGGILAAAIWAVSYLAR